MTPRWQDVRRIVEAALDLDGVARQDYVQAVCGQDDRLRREVEAVLDQDAASHPYLDQAPGSVVRQTAAELELAPGTQLGAWQVRRWIASGGMGAVYEGERSDSQFEKRVAIKVVKPGMDSAEVLRRFENERQVLADLEHPGIARLLDGGATAEGRPFLVMEYVDGEPIDVYCQSRRLPLEDRLHLFSRVCKSVQAAHQALIVHRDLKPSNVLVTAQGEPKLVDFGISKALDATGSDATRATRGPRAMTPEYATPEQVRGDRITTATDVYALGLILFELLTDQRPFRFDDLSWTSIERVVLQQEPPLPSSVAAPALARKLRGDLDNVVCKAMHKEQGRRYGSAQELATDLRNQQAGLPVSARADTLSYRATKFVARNRAMVTLAGLCALALVLALLITWSQYRRALQASQLSERRLAEVRGMARTFLHDLDGFLIPIEGATPAREFVVQTGLSYLNGLLGAGAGVGVGVGAGVEAGEDRELLLEVAEGFVRIGDIQGGALLANLGRREDARVSYQKALRIAERLDVQFPNDPLVRARLVLGHHRLGTLEEMAGSLGRAREEYLEAARGLQSLPSLEQQVTLQNLWLQVESSLFTLAAQTGQFEEALTHAQAHLSAARRYSDGTPAVESQQVGGALAQVGRALTFLSRHAEAQECLREATALARTGCAYHPGDRRLRENLSYVLTALALCLQLQEQHEECVAIQREILSLERGSADADAADVLAQRGVLVALINLGQTLVRMDLPDQAYEVATEQVDLARHILDSDPGNSRSRSDHVSALITLTRSLVQLGEPEEALDPCLEAMEHAEHLVEARPNDALALQNAALVGWDLGKVHRARARLEAERERKIELMMEARDAFGAGLDQFQELADQDRLAPTHFSFLPTWRQDLEDCVTAIEQVRGEVVLDDGP